MKVFKTRNSKENPEEINKYLEKITFQREQMGPVNLRAKIEEKRNRNIN